MYNELKNKMKTFKTQKRYGKNKEKNLKFKIT